MKRQSVCRTTVDQCHEASLQTSVCLHGHAVSLVLGALVLGLVVEVAKVTPCTWPSLQKKDALPVANKLSLSVQES